MVKFASPGSPKYKEPENFFIIPRTNKNCKTQINIYTSDCGRANVPTVKFILMEIQIQLHFECFTRTSNKS